MYKISFSILLTSVVHLYVAIAFQTPRPQTKVGIVTHRTQDVSILGSSVSPTKNHHCRQPLHQLQATTNKEDTNSKTTTTDDDDKPSSSHNPLKQAYHLYIDYFDRLWSDTDVNQRQKLAKERATESILHVKNMVSSNGKGVGEEYLWKENNEGEEEDTAVFADLDETVRQQMEESCDLMLKQLNDSSSNKKKKKKKKKVLLEKEVVVAAAAAAKPNEIEEIAAVKTIVEEVDISPLPLEKKKKKGGRSVLFGATMGLAVAGWVYSGNYIFTALFTLMTALGQLEYYRMVMNTGVYPARRISVLGACGMFVTALFAPDLHQITLPVVSTWAMMWFLLKRSSISSISEIATTFTGMFYLGYIPSFWVRIRQLGGDIVQPTRLAPLVKPILDFLGQKKLPAFLPKTIKFPITEGANFIFWTWLCIAFSDVGGYFAGRKFGKTKLGAISPAAGKTSPNKTVEGVIGGCAFSLVLATLGAWIQKWPYWFVLGPIHGVMLALLGLVGDLTASMLKRDAGLKDFGDLIPEHGGIMDRVDSYIFTAPYGWLLCSYVIPLLQKLADSRAAAAVLAV